MIPVLWHLVGAVVFALVAYRSARRLRTAEARVASILRLVPWAVFFFWPIPVTDFAGLAVETSAVFAILFATSWYARAFLRDADRSAAAERAG